MKLFFILIVVFATIFLTTQLLSANQREKKDKTPKLFNGHLLACPNKPNCINTEYPNQSSHYLAPFVFLSDQQNKIMPAAKKILLAMGATIHTENDDYLSATFTSKLFKFIDDFELRLDKTSQTLHIRSASRTGYSDFGVNKRRVKYFLELIENNHWE